MEPSTFTLYPGEEYHKDERAGQKPDNMDETSTDQAGKSMYHRQRPAASELYISIARVMMGNSPELLDGSFIKGYEKGFENGWTLGFERGRKEGRHEMAVGKNKGASNSSSEIAEDHHCCCNSLTLTRQKMCLLSDVPMNEEGGSDARSVSSSADSESSNLMDVYHDARSHLTSSPASGKNGGHMSSSARQIGSNITHPSSDPVRSDQNLENVHPRNRNAQGTATFSPGPGRKARANAHHVVAGEARSKMPGTANDIISSEKEEENLIWLETASTSATDKVSNGNGICFAAVTESMTNTFSVKETKIEENEAEKAKEEEKEASACAHAPSTPPATSPADNNINTTSTTTPITTTLYGIPCPPAVRPLTPDLSTSPRTRRGPRPAYPALGGGPLDAYALRARGARVVENPWRVLVGPLSAAAREAWRHDGGKAYLRSRLETPGVAARYYGGDGGGGGGGRAWDSGLVFCDMISDGNGVWYILATFDRQDRARMAVEVFRGYACGGTIMWAWNFQEEE
ncbi:hypothetical protein VTH82DRAFT_1640 [Thermothelomyces myriococcoides]